MDLLGRILAMSVSRRQDAVFMGLVAASAMLASILFLAEGGTLLFYQGFTRSIVMFACGHGLVEPAVVPNELFRFVWLQTPAFDCRHLDGVSPLGVDNWYLRSQLYLSGLAALLWRWLGVSYSSLWPLVALLHVGFATGAYALGRLVFNPVIALIIGAAIAFSPVAVAMLFYLRDYSKAPFLIWTVVAFILALRATSPGRLVAYAALAGALAGVGKGFRDDTIIMMPALLIGLAVCAMPMARAMAWRLAAIVVLVGAMWLTSLPLRLGPSVQTGLGSAVLQGATEGFHRHLGLEKPLYDLGWKYSDEMTLAAFSSSVRERDPDAYDRAELQPISGFTQAMPASGSYLAHVARLFPYDFLARGVKSAMLLAGFYPLFGPEARALDVSTVGNYPGRSRIARVGAQIVRPLTSALMIPVGLIGLAILGARIYLRRPAELLAWALVLGTLLVAPSLQFSYRHFFHYEPFALLTFAAVLTAAPAVYRQRHELRGYWLWLSVCVGALLMLGAALAQYQDQALRRSFAGLLAAPRQAIETARAELPDGRVRLEVPVPAELRPLVDGPPDSHAKSNARYAMPWNVRASLQRLALTLKPGCLASATAIELSYATGPETWQPLTRTIEVHPDGGITTIVFPAIYRPTQHFQGVSMSGKTERCVASIERIGDGGGVPTILTGVFYSTWAEEWLVLGLGRLVHSR